MESEQQKIWFCRRKKTLKLNSTQTVSSSASAITPVQLIGNNRLKRILPNHVMKLVFSLVPCRQSLHPSSDVIIDLKEMKLLLVLFKLLYTHSPMREVEKTKRSEKSLQPYRFLLNGATNEKWKPLISLLEIELTMIRNQFSCRNLNRPYQATTHVGNCSRLNERLNFG